MFEIEMGCGFVQQQYRGGLCECTRDEGTPMLAAGETGNRTVRQLQCVGHRHRAGRGGEVLRPFAGHAVHVGVPAHEDDLPNREIEERRFRLGNERDGARPIPRRHGRRGSAIEQNLTGTGPQHPGQDAEKSGFAATVRADETDELPRHEVH